MGEMTHEMENSSTVLIQNNKNYQEHYKLCEELGKGRFGVVRRAIHQKTGEIVAVKTIKAIRAR